MDLLISAPGRLPRPVVDLSTRLGARTDGTAVRLIQRGTMRSGPTARRMKFSARQTIQFKHPEFEWQASIGPLGCITLVDALHGWQTRSELRLFGGLRLVGAKPNDASVLKGQILRYLAELAWAPDAIVQNEMLQWSVHGNSMSVTIQHGNVSCALDITLDDEGRIGSVFAPDRPRKEGNHFVERPWRGRFSDYRKHRGRWLPFKAEVDWVVDESPVNVWQGELTDWKADGPGPPPA